MAHQESVERLPLLEILRDLTPEKLREQVRSFTGQQLEQLIAEMERTREVPEIFRSAHAQELVDRRIHELKDVRGETRARWEKLKGKVGGVAGQVEEKAEQRFLEKLLDKGGGWAVLGTVGITLLAWLGVKWAKKIKERGFLKSAIEGVKEHPIFALFLAALGVGVSAKALEYFRENHDGIVDHIEGEAAQTGRSPEAIARNLGDQARDIVQNIGTATVDAFVRGIATIFGGTVDPETGMITLPHSTLRPPVIIAFQAGYRRRGGPRILQKAFSAFAVESKLNSIIREQQSAAHLSNENRMLADKARRARELMHVETGRPLSGPESKELRTLLGDLDPVLKLPEVQIETQRRRKARILGPIRERIESEDITRLKTAERHCDTLYRQEMEEFNRTKQVLTGHLDRLDSDIREGKIGATENARDRALGEMKTSMEHYEAELVKKKLAATNEFVDIANEHVRHRVNTQVGGYRLEGAARGMEHVGVRIGQTRGGRLAVKGLIGYSFLPLAAEIASAAAHGELTLASERGRVVARDVGEAVGGFIPIVGEAMDFRAAFTGKDTNGRALSTGARVTAGVMGTLGTASLVLGVFTGGLSVVGFRAIRGLAAGRKAWKVARVVKGATKGADTAAEIANAAKKGEKAVEAAQQLSRTAKFTDTQRRLLKARGLVHMAQRGMQVYTYGHLGYQLVTGPMVIWQQAGEAVEAGKEWTIEKIDAAEEFVTGHAPEAGTHETL